MTNPIISLTDATVFTVLRSFLLSVLPANVEVVRGLVNRVPEPIGADFVVMTPILRQRLETNTDGYSNLDYEVLTFGSITNIPVVGNVLVNGTTTAVGTVSAVNGLAVTVTSLTGQYFAINDVVTNQTLSLPVGTISSVAYGGKSVLQPTRMTVQLDVHGPNSADNAQIISTLFRDQYATDQFATSNADVIPLYADDPKQMPFTNGEQQIEVRWIIEAVMQINPSTVVPMQFMDAASVGIVSVEAAYPN